MVSSAERGQESPNPKAMSPGSSSSPPSRRANRRSVFLKLSVAGIVAAMIGGGWWIFSQGRQDTDDAYVAAHISNVSSRVSGMVSRVLVVDNQLVKEGDLIAELDANDYSVKVEEAEAALEEAKHSAEAARNKINQTSLSSQGQTTQASADVSTVQAQISEARFAVKQSRADIQRMEMKIHEQEAQVRFAAADYERYKSVYAERVVTKQQFDKAKETYDIAQAQLEQARNSLQFEHDKELQAKAQLDEAVERLKKSEGGVTAAMASQHGEKVDQEEYQSSIAAVKKAEAELKQAKLDLSYTKILSPVTGRVGHKSVEVGQRVEAGQLLLAIVQPHPWVAANFKETQIGSMRPGQKAEIKLDAFGNKVFTGRVDSLSPASGAKFSMLPPDNATGNFTKVVQRVEVKLVFDDKSIKDIQDDIAPGMSCNVTVFTKPE